MTQSPLNILEAALVTAVGQALPAALNDLAEALGDVDSQRALELASEAGRLAREHANPREILRSTLSQGVAWLTLGHLHEAETALRTSHHLAQEQQEDALIARSLRFLGETLVRQGQTNEALPLLSEALVLYTTLQEPLGEAECFNTLGILADMHGQYAEAFEYHRNALQRRQDAGEEAQVARSLGNLGHVWAIMGDHGRALTYHLQALAVFERLAEEYNVARAWINVAVAQERLDQPDLALSLNQRALPILQRHGDEVNAALVQANLSSLYVKTGEPSTAVTLAQQALTVFEEQGVLPLRAVALLALGEAYLALGELDAARSALELAVSRSQEDEMFEVTVQAHETLATVLEHLQDWRGAHAQLNHCLKLERQLSRHQATQRTQALLIDLETDTARREADAARQRAQELQRLNTDLEATQRQNLFLLERLENHAYRDVLTDLHNRRYFTEQFGAKQQWALEHQQPLTLAVFDIDHFKRINDTYSHLTGDLVLQGVARLLQAHLAAADLLIRYGGEEFVLLMPGTQMAEAEERCEAILREVETHHWEALPAHERVTLSAGLADLGQMHLEGGLMGQADRKLYEAKMAGRNCLRC
ncbi:diguanylate cyclase [Deinococcus oregonensis]|uniref:Diguanylate cyclase n=1 Tax=Deinococcus oregonensis TaxID=1805970 RepID=A0ABV6ATT7_9DEIO